MRLMIDTVAQAIRCKVWMRDLEGDDPGTWDSISEDAKGVWRQAARAAIEALREPTDSMIMEAKNIIDAEILPVASISITPDLMRLALQAAIYEALK